MKKVFKLSLLALFISVMVFGQGRWNPTYRAIGLNLRPVALASAAGALTLTPGYSYFTVSGTETVTSIVTDAGHAGQIIFLQTSSTCAFTDGSNLKLAGSFSASANDVIVLISNGTNWYQLAKSAN